MNCVKVTGFSLQLIESDSFYEIFILSLKQECEKIFIFATKFWRFYRVVDKTWIYKIYCRLPSGTWKWCISGRRNIFSCFFEVVFFDTWNCGFFKDQTGLLFKKRIILDDIFLVRRLCYPIIENDDEARICRTHSLYICQGYYSWKKRTIFQRIIIFCWYFF